jgi:ketosteroid isomerase-like protein
MSRENVEIARRLYQAWSRLEIPGPEDLLDPEIEYVNPPGAIEPGVRRGLDEFGAAVRRVFEGWSRWEMEPERFDESGDHVAVIVRYRASGRTSGIDVEGRESALLTIRDGKVVRYEWFHHPGDAGRAIGRPVADAGTLEPTPADDR